MDLRNIVSQFRGKPGQSSRPIFTAVGRPDVPKPTRNDILETIASVKAPLKMPLLKLTQKFEEGIGQKIFEDGHESRSFL